MSLSRSVQRTVGRLATAVEGAAAMILALLVIGVAWETLSWLLFAAPPPWAEEVQGILLIWFGFLAAAAGVHRGAHLGVDWLEARLPPSVRRWSRRGAGLLVALFGGLVTFYGAALASAVRNRLPATGWSAAVEYLPAVVGGTLIVVFASAVALTPAVDAATDDDRG